VTFIDWDPLGRAGLFGGIFLVSLFAALWLWYDSSGGRDDSRWTWRIFASLLVALTIPAVFLGAANLDQNRETLLNVFAWVAMGTGAAALVTVAAYATTGRSAGAWPVQAGDGDTLPFERSSELPPAPPVPPTVAEPQKPRAPALAYFFVKDGPDQGKQFPLYEVAIVGRSEGCAVALDDKRVSREHAQVKRNGGSFVFTDMESVNGSYLIVEGREERIRSSQVLVDGDRLRVGQTVLEFVEARGGRRR